MPDFKTKQTHKEKVALLQKVMQAKEGPLSLKKSLSNTLRDGGYKKNTCKLDLSPLNGIIEIDPEKKIAKVEPRVTIEKLVEATKALGLIPPVVPEFRTITVGGAVNGAALESTSHQYGQFNDACLEYEVLLGSGELIRANREENADLFFGLSGSYGTLGVITLITLKLIPAKKGVRLTLTRYASSKEVIEAMQELLKGENRPDIIEGGVLDRNWTVLITGFFVDAFTNVPRLKQKKPWDPWYYQQITEKSAQSKETTVEMPLEDYLFRFDRGAFWMGRFLLSWVSMLKICFKWRLPEVIGHVREAVKKLHARVHPPFLFRLLFGWTLSSKKLYEVWHKVPKEISEQLLFVQDFYTPQESALKGIEAFSQETGIYPLWLCPIKAAGEPQILSPHYSKKEKFFINIGVYGVPSVDKPVPEITAECEEIIYQLGGRKMLYSLSYFSKNLFEKIYDMEAYAALSKKYFAGENFLPIYTKIRNK